jgi:predicted nuclease with TOPRIM domain
MGRTRELSGRIINRGFVAGCIKKEGGRIIQMRGLTVFLAVALIVALSGCGVSKAKYEELLSEKLALEERVEAAENAKTALKTEYDKLLAEKLDLASKLEVANNEKSALKAEYDKLLDEKIALTAAQEKLQQEYTELKERGGRR